MLAPIQFLYSINVYWCILYSNDLIFSNTYYYDKDFHYFYECWNCTISYSVADINIFETQLRKTSIKIYSFTWLPTSQ